MEQRVRKEVQRKPAFHEGIEGFCKNRVNPYKAGTLNHKEWEAGYNSAYFRCKSYWDKRSAYARAA